MNSSVLIIIGILVYAAFMVWHGFHTFRTTKQDSESYFTADRGVNPFILLCTTSISIFSGLAFYGFPSAYYRLGVGYYAAIGGYVAALMFVLIGYRLWLLGKEYGFTTPAEYLRARYYSNWYGYMVAGILVVFIVPYVALQLITIGEGMTHTTGGMMPYAVAVALGTVVVCLHIYGGGMKSVAWLDTFHVVLGLATLAGIIVYLTVTYFPEGGLAEATSIVQNTPELAPILSHPGPQGTFNWQGTLSLALSGAVATVVWPHIFMRAFIARDRQSFVQLSWSMPISYMVIHGALMILGVILAPAIVGPGFANADALMPTLTSQYATPLISFFALLCLFAFAVSTADSLLLSATGIASRDLYMPFKMSRGENVDSEKVVAFSRKVLLVIMFITLWVVWQRPAYIVDYAYKLSSPGFAMILPATIAGIFWKKATKEGAIAGTLTGLIAVVLFTFFIAPPAGLSNILIGLAANTIVLVGVSLKTSVPAEIEEKYFTRLTELMDIQREHQKLTEQAILSSNKS